MSLFFYESYINILNTLSVTKLQLLPSVKAKNEKYLKNLARDYARVCNEVICLMIYDIK